MKNYILIIILLIIISSCSLSNSEVDRDSVKQACDINISKVQENHLNVNQLNNAGISLDKKTVYILDANEITTYQSATLQKENYFQVNEGNVIDISPNGKIAVVILSNSNLSLWDLETNSQISLLTIPEYHNEKINIAFSPSGNQIAGTWGSCEYGKNTAVWEINTGKLLWHTKKGLCVGNGIAYSPDGKTIASGVSYSRTLYLFDAKNGNPQEVFSEKQPEWVSSVIFSQTGKLLAFGAGPIGEGILLAPIIILDTSNNEVLKTFDGKRDTVHSLSISPNDEIIAVGTGDGAIILWNIKTGSHLCTLDVNQNKIDVFFTQDNSFLSVQQDGVIKLWVLNK